MDHLNLNKLDNASVQALTEDIHTIRRELISLKSKRGRQKGAFVADVNYWFQWMYFLESALRERLGMAKSRDERATWKGFVDVKLTESEKEMFGQWDVHDNDLFVLLSEATAAGHKFSLSFNKNNDTFVCSFTGNEGTGKHEGYTLSAYAGDWYIACRALLFKHTMLLEGDWETAKDRPSEQLG